jgi:dienelactone hydrolase
MGRQYHRSRSDDFLHRNTAVLATRGLFIPIPNAYLPVRCQLYHSTCHDAHDRAAPGACWSRDRGLDHIAIYFIKEHVVPQVKAGSDGNLTIMGVSPARPQTAVGPAPFCRDCEAASPKRTLALKVLQARMNHTMIRLASVLLSFLLLSPLVNAEEVATFPSGEITLHGALYKPAGKGPFPAVVYNHGSAAGMLSASAFAALGPVFASHGWVFFGPYRSGQGLSASAGPYIGDQIAAAQKSGGDSAAAAVMVQLLETDHLDDQLAALGWLRKQQFVQPDRIAVVGTSFGGIETVLGAERGSYCAAIDSAGGAQSWPDAPELQHS